MGPLRSGPGPGPGRHTWLQPSSWRASKRLFAILCSSDKRTPCAAHLAWSSRADEFALPFPFPFSFSFSLSFLPFSLPLFSFSFLSPPPSFPSFASLPLFPPSLPSLPSPVFTVQSPLIIPLTIPALPRPPSWMGDNNLALMDVNTESPTVQAVLNDWIGSFVREYAVDGLRIDGESRKPVSPSRSCSRHESQASSERFFFWGGGFSG